MNIKKILFIAIVVLAAAAAVFIIGNTGELGSLSANEYSVDKTYSETNKDKLEKLSAEFVIEKAATIKEEITLTGADEFFAYVEENTATDEVIIIFEKKGEGETSISLQSGEVAADSSEIKLSPGDYTLNITLNEGCSGRLVIGFN